MNMSLKEPHRRAPFRQDLIPQILGKLVYWLLCCPKTRCKFHFTELRQQQLTDLFSGVSRDAFIAVMHSYK